jgi:RNA polymerase sigma-70 factor
MAAGSDDQGRLVARPLAQYSVAVRSYLAAAAGDYHDAEDLFQDVSMTVWENRGSFRPGTDFCAWALAIARNRFLAHHKRCRGSTALMDPQALERLAEATRRIVERTDVSARKRALRECFESLSDAARLALADRYRRLEPAEVAAARLGRTLSAYYSYLKRIRAALRRCVDGKLAGAEAAG